jgi:hypothetical protein
MAKGKKQQQRAQKRREIEAKRKGNTTKPLLSYWRVEKLKREKEEEQEEEEGEDESEKKNRRLLRTGVFIVYYTIVTHFH